MKLVSLKLVPLWGLCMLVAGLAFAQAEAPPAADPASSGGPRVVARGGVQPRLLARVGTTEIWVPDLLQFATSNNHLPHMGSQKGRSDVLFKLIVGRMIYQAALDEGLITKDSSQSEVRLAVAELQRRHFPPPPPLSDEEAAAYFERHKDEYAIPAQARIRQILIEVPAEPSDEALETAIARAEAAFRRLESGEAFEAVAAEVTENAETKAAGGDLGYVPLLSGSEHADALLSLEPGEHTGVLKSAKGYEILQLTDRKAPMYPAFEQVRTKIKQQVGQAEFQRRRTEYIKELAQKTEITIEMPEYEAAHPKNRTGSDLNPI